jgi:outer membrane receptor protein involved in Fe transport
VAGATYFDLAVSYMFGGEGQYEVYFNARNIFNKDPAIVPRGPTGYQSWTNNPFDASQYDALGRVFRAGFRFKI